MSKASEFQYGLTKSDLQCLAASNSPYRRCGNPFYPDDDILLRKAARWLEIWSETTEEEIWKGSLLADDGPIDGISLYDRLQNVFRVLYE
jgi:hypothetical protein